MSCSRPHAGHGPGRGTPAAAPTVDAPFGHALAALGADAAGHRRADRRPRQVHRHPAVPRRLSRPLLQCRHGRAEPRRRRRRPRPHRQDAASPRPTASSPRAAPTTSSRSPARTRNLNVKIVAGLPGLTTGYGGTHQAIEDLGADADDPRPHRHRSVRRHRDRRGDRGHRRPHGPVYMRLLRGAVPVVLEPGYRFEIGKARVLREGTRRRHRLDRPHDRARARRRRGARPRGASPSASCMCRRSSRSTPRPSPTFAAGVDQVVTAENHVVVGGLASLVVETLFDAGVSRKVTRIGLPDRYIECGSVPTLQARYGLTTEAIVATIAGLRRGCAMKITDIETFTVGAGWKNWLFVRVHTDDGIHGVGEGTLNGFITTTEAGVHELEAPRDRPGPAPHQRARQAHARQRLARRRPHPPHRRSRRSRSPAGTSSARSSACRSTSSSAAGCATACSATPMAGTAPSARRRRSSRRRSAVLAKGFKAFKLDPFGTAQGFISREELDLSYDICRTLRDKLPARHAAS